MKDMHKIRGFTLIEIIITVVLLGIVIAIAIPDFTSTIQNNAINSASARFISSISLARSEAIKRDVPVSICATSDQNFNSCGSNWNLGWIVFVNPTGGSSLSAPLLRVENLNSNAMNITVSPAVNIATYNGSGFAANNTKNVAFTIKATGCTADAGRRITISVTGRPVVSNVNCP